MQPRARHTEAISAVYFNSAMKQIIIAIFILQGVLARPQHNKDASITWFENFNDGLGNFRFAFQTSNGITQQQSGLQKSLDSADPAIVMQGLFSFEAPDTSLHQVRYIADENGYQAQVSIGVPVSNVFSARSSSDQKEDSSEVVHVGHNEEPKPDGQVTKPPVVFALPPANLTGTPSGNNTNGTGSGEFPDRIGTPAIITLMGPPG